MVRLIGWTIGLLVALAIVAAAINAVDETLSPEVAELLKPAPVGVSDLDNGYYLLVGLDAPAGADARAYGMKVADRMRRADDELRNTPRAVKLKRAEQDLQQAVDKMGSKGAKPAAAGEPDRLLIKAGTIKYLCPKPWGSLQQTSCLVRAGSSAADIDRVLQENREALDRYRRLAAAPALVEAYVPKDPIGPTTSFFALNLFHRLWVTQAALRFEKGDGEGAAADLERDMALMRAMLRGGRSYSFTVPALVHLESDVVLLTEMIVARPAFARQSAARIEAMLAPLTPEELRWTKFEKGEATAFRTLLEWKPAFWHERLLAPFFQRNATANLLYPSWKMVYGWDELTADRDPALRSRIQQANEKLRMRYATAFYNPVGKWWMSEADFSDRQHFIERYYDFDGLRRLALLAAAVVALPAAEIPAALEKAGPRLADPYTGKPMRWDPERKQIFFEPRSDYWLGERTPVGGVTGRLGIRVLP